MLANSLADPAFGDVRRSRIRNRSGRRSAAPRNSNRGALTSVRIRAMRLSGNGKTSLHLSLEGYQFPNLLGTRFDSNWLIVRVEIHGASGSWTFVDPCLLTFEVEELAQWLRAAAEGDVPVVATRSDGQAASQLGFLEPFMGFGVAGRNHEVTSIRVHFSSGGAPPWRPDERAVVGWTFFEVFDVCAEDLRAAATNLEAQLTAFPER